MTTFHLLETILRENTRLLKVRTMTTIFTACVCKNCHPLNFYKFFPHEMLDIQTLFSLTYNMLKNIIKHLELNLSVTFLILFLLFCHLIIHIEILCVVLVFTHPINFFLPDILIFIVNCCKL